MKQLMQFALIVLVLGGVLLVLGTYGAQANMPWVENALEWMRRQPVLGDIVGPPPMTLSRWVTLLLLVSGAVYIVFHLIEMLFGGVARMFGTTHSGLASKRAVGSFFLSAMIVKGLLVVLQVALLFAQALSFSKLLKDIVENPKTFYDVLRTDVVFLVILVLLILIRCVLTPGSPREG